MIKLKWRIERNKTYAAGPYPWSVWCPRFFTIAYADRSRHLQYCNECDVFPTAASARRYVADRIAS